MTCYNSNGCSRYSNKILKLLVNTFTRIHIATAFIKRLLIVFSSHHQSSSSMRILQTRTSVNYRFLVHRYFTILEMLQSSIFTYQGLFRGRRRPLVASLESLSRKKIVCDNKATRRGRKRITKTNLQLLNPDQPVSNFEMILHAVKTSKCYS